MNDIKIYTHMIWLCMYIICLPLAQSGSRMYIYTYHQVNKFWVTLLHIWYICVCPYMSITPWFRLVTCDYGMDDHTTIINPGFRDALPPSNVATGNLLYIYVYIWRSTAGNGKIVYKWRISYFHVWWPEGIQRNPRQSQLWSLLSNEQTKTGNNKWPTKSGLGMIIVIPK